PSSSARRRTATSSASVTSSTATARRCRSRAGTSSTRGTSSRASAPTHCAGTSSPRARPGPVAASPKRASARRRARRCSRCGTSSRSSPRTQTSMAGHPPASRPGRRTRSTAGCSTGSTSPSPPSRRPSTTSTRSPAPPTSPPSWTTCPTGTCAGRTEARVRVRQPLRRALLLHPGAELSDDVRREVADELNVKVLEDVESLAGLMSWTVVPNFKALGPRLGPRVNQVKQALAAAAGSELKQALDEQGFIEVAGERLGPDDVEVRAREHEDFALAQEGAWAVAIDLDLDDALR